jgi:hemolysin activation/secretion protein
VHAFSENRVLIQLKRDARGKRYLSAAVAVVAFGSLQAFGAESQAANRSKGENPGQQPQTEAVVNRTAVARNERPFFIREYRVVGAHHLSRIEIEAAVYPFLGPGRTSQDVEEARAALEKAFQDKGYQTASVQVPPQSGAHGIITLRVVENKVGRLRVRNSRYFSLKKIKEAAPSLAEGAVPNFNAVTHDIVALNQLPDRRITPSIRAGVIPGTVDVDLDVKDTLPLHGSVELNNRYSPDTSPLRVNVSASYNNLWQLGHGIGGSVQLSPEDINQVQVYSGYYVLRFPDPDWLTFVVQGIDQKSNVSTLGALAVAGRGQVIGGRAIITLPPTTNFFHTITFGFDYKHFEQGLNASGMVTDTPVTYYPFSANYSATWSQKDSVTNADFGVTWSVRGLGSSPQEFDQNRYKADANFIYLRGDLSHQHDLPGGFQAFGKVQGQVSDQPLVNSEQFAGGGLATVRGYLEAETLGDNGVCGSVELRSPSFLNRLGAEANEGRIYVFADGGYLTLIDPLPEQDSTFALASVGVGGRVHLYNHLNGSIDAAVPFISQTQTNAFDWRVTFRVWGDF